MKNDFIMPILVLTLLCIVLSGALAFMNNVTSPLITTAAARRAEEAMNVNIPHATGFERIDTVSLSGLPTTVREVYKAMNDVGYIFIVVQNGFGGDMTIICGVDPEGRIIGVSVLSHTETKGIGTIIEQASFLDTFIDKDNRLEGVDTVTGATISTRAFISAIRDVHEAFELVREG